MGPEWRASLAFVFALGACSSPDSTHGSNADDPEPTFTNEEKAALATLRYDDAPPPADPSNFVADEPLARELGQRLFFDPSFSGTLLDGDNDGGPSSLGKVGDWGRVSCAGCHVPDDHFVDTRSPHRQISLAARWTVRRAPTLLEVAFAPLYNWDGRRDSIWNQAMGVMESDREFNSGRLFVAQQMARAYPDEYVALFGPLPPVLDEPTRFPLLAPEDAGCWQVGGVVKGCRGKPGDGAEYDGMTVDDQKLVTRVTVNVAKAIGAYVRLLRCGPSRFDAWLDGDDQALDRAEQRGAALFVGRGGCVTCHSGPRLTDGEFHNVGLSPAIVAVAFVDSDDRGAAEGIADALLDPLNTQGEFSDGDRHALPSTVGPELEGAFRTPTLRCIGKQPSFLHTGQFRTLEQVVGFFDRGGDLGPYPGKSELHPLDLSERERADLTAFLRALDGLGANSALVEAP